MESRTCIGSWIWDLQSQAGETKDSIRGKLSVKVSEDSLHVPTLTINSQQKGARAHSLQPLAGVRWGGVNPPGGQVHKLRFFPYLHFFHRNRRCPQVTKFPKWKLGPHDNISYPVWKAN